MENININNSECIVERVHLLSTEYVNICTGDSTTVPFSTYETGMMLFTIFLFGCIVGLCVYMLRKVME